MHVQKGKEIIQGTQNEVTHKRDIGKWSGETFLGIRAKSKVGTGNIMKNMKEILTRTKEEQMKDYEKGTRRKGEFLPQFLDVFAT